MLFSAKPPTNEFFRSGRNVFKPGTTKDLLSPFESKLSDMLLSFNIVVDVIVVWFCGVWALSSY